MDKCMMDMNQAGIASAKSYVNLEGTLDLTTNSGETFIHIGTNKGYARLWQISYKNCGRVQIVLNINRF